MRIGISAPITINELKEYIYDGDCDIEGLRSPIITRLVKEFIKENNQVVVFTLDREITKPRLLKGENLTIYVGPYRKKSIVKKFDFYLNEREFLFECMKKEKMDILNAHWTYEFALPAIKYNLNSIITVRDWGPRIFALNPSPVILKRLILDRYTVYKGRFFSSNSEYIAKKLKSKRPNLDVKVIPNGLNSASFNNNDKSLNLTRPKIIAINNGFDNVKNVKNILRFFKEINKDLPQATLSLIGKENGRNEKAHHWAQENNCCENVNFVGYLDYQKVMEVCRNSDLLIHLSREESFGGVLLEAMAQKLPVIGGVDSGAVPWLLNYGEAGMLVNVDDIDDVKEKTIRILTDSELWDKYSTSGFNYVYNNFRIEEITKKYLEYYEEVSINFKK
ncbi:glycosyltransferase family 4 protein [Clostridium sp. YIM B02515]|uniref:Glycosyltransferase family 4 protein n=1 Tax=Clostridium rhizosphaerae TaxID=2803861 RepID=A0ABS1TAG6_9CLOT|nr:glycosyltransferase family 4 protein [Clostridium rhizosphaerae]MBL4936335.1 glycosyltransferase family 4 protein [Clostridium rhizosphaerae]